MAEGNLPIRQPIGGGRLAVPVKVTAVGTVLDSTGQPKGLQAYTAKVASNAIEANWRQIKFVNIVEKTAGRAFFVVDDIVAVVPYSRAALQTLVGLTLPNDCNYYAESDPRGFL